MCIRDRPYHAAAPRAASGSRRRCVENLAELRREGPLVERLGEERRPVVRTELRRDVGGVSRHEHHFDRRPVRPHALGQIAPVHSRHHDVSRRTWMTPVCFSRRSSATAPSWAASTAYPLRPRTVRTRFLTATSSSTTRTVSVPRFEPTLGCVPEVVLSSERGR